MKDFDVYKWNSKRRLAAVNENAVGLAIDKAIASVDDSMSAVDFAKGVAYVLKEEYGPHNFQDFISTLEAELGDVNEGAMDRDQIAQKLFGKTCDDLDAEQLAKVDTEYEKDIHNK